MHRSLFVILFVLLPIVGIHSQENVPTDEKGDSIDGIIADLPEEGQGRYDALQEAAVAAQGNGDLDIALELYEMLQELAPDSGEIMYNRGTLYLARGEYDRAITLFTRGEDSGFEDYRVFYNRGNGFFAVGEYEGALRDYERAAELAPEDPEILNNLGLTEIQLEMFELAETHLLEAAGIDESYADPLFHLSGLYEGQGNIESAIEALSSAIARNDLFVAAYYNRGALYYQQEAFRDAVNDYLAALRLEPNDPDILYNLGVSALAAATGRRPAIQTESRDGTEEQTPETRR